MNKLLTLMAFLSLIFFSCSNLKNQDKNENNALDSKQVKNNQEKRKDYIIKKNSKSTFIEIEDPKVLTYEEIFEINKNYQEQYIRSLPYSSDSLELKESLKYDYFRHLTTQFKYMLSTELRLLRNEFFARKGYVFKTKDLSDFFKQRSWYKPIHQDSESIPISVLEKMIIDTIAYYEEKNKSLRPIDFQDSLRIWFKEKNSFNYGYETSVSVPKVLFRRNIGYLAKKLKNHHKNWFNHEFMHIRIIDTLTSQNLLLGLFGQINCPNEYCHYGGELITCDSLLNYIDSYSVEFEHFEKINENQLNEYVFKVVTPYKMTIHLFIDNQGKFSRR
ncbi:MAG: YARHG domain-containing protein [bacterium]